MKGEETGVGRSQLTEPLSSHVHDSACQGLAGRKKPYWFAYLFILIGGQLLYNIVVVFAIH